MRRLITTVCAVLTLLSVQVSRAETVTVYTSSISAPLMVGESEGIYRDLVAYLNRQKLGITFLLSYLPRKRLQLMVEKGKLDGIVIGMMPQWFNDAQQKRYLWTGSF